MKKIFFIVLSLILLFSCKKEEEYVTFMILNNGFYFGQDSLSLDYSVIAPGRVNIQDHGVEYRSFTQTNYQKISFGSLKKAGTFHGVVPGLNMGSSYYFRLYAISDGKQIYSKEYTGSTLMAPKIHF